LCSQCRFISIGEAVDVDVVVDVDVAVRQGGREKSYVRAGTMRAQFGKCRPQINLQRKLQN